jgi:hypothetical protein
MQFLKQAGILPIAEKPGDQCRQKTSILSAVTKGKVSELTTAFNTLLVKKAAKAIFLKLLLLCRPIQCAERNS